jgi:hypothetical protein
MIVVTHAMPRTSDDGTEAAAGRRTEIVAGGVIKSRQRKMRAVPSQVGVLTIASEM